MTKKVAMKRESNPIVVEFQNLCRLNNVQDEMLINQISTVLMNSDTCLKLINVRIPNSFCKIIQKFIQKPAKISKLAFYSCTFDDFSILTQLTGEVSKSSLNGLAFNYMPLEREKINLILQLPIEGLSVKGNRCLSYSPEIYPTSFNAFLNGLIVSSVKSLNLSDCHLGDCGTQAFARMLHFNHTLSCVSLTGNRIGDVGAIALASALGFYVLSLQEKEAVDHYLLAESQVSVSDDGSSLSKKKKGQKPPKKPAPNVATGKVKKAANSAQTRTYDFGQANLIMSVQWTTRITDDDGVVKIPGNRTLTTLLLDYNEISSVGAEAFRKALETNDNIANFSISHNAFLDEQIAQSLTKRATTD